ncbi:2648_t:CDS:2 [Cetraspora pellucida]|uniref:Large ribosomal subunit protein uL4m n=1 Tax=Cetraspora pellucida TaxID=1433469 RepID=A0A9N9A216_9GLOM|nr:2648_t:CDS:2 [Cetraspora pellucida]
MEVINQNGDIVSSIFLNPNIWQNTHKTKNKSEVKKTTKKWRRQKGTGMARQGPRSNPHFVGGGVAHGPRGEKKSPLVTNKKVKKKALQLLLSEKIRRKEIIVVEKIILENYKTKEAEKILVNLLNKKVSSLVILGKKEENKKELVRAFRNLPYAQITESQNINVFQVLTPRYLVFTQNA